MTSQVSVMSVFGVAVASDTVLTLSQGDHYKVVPNASKIIELGPSHKVLILSSGNVKLNSFPHELHVTEWAKTLETPLPTLVDYVLSYKSWAATESKLATASSQIAALYKIVDAEILELEEALKEHRAPLVEEWTERLLSSYLSDPGEGFTETLQSDFDKAHARKTRGADRRFLTQLLRYKSSSPDFDSLSRPELLAQLSSRELGVKDRIKLSMGHLEFPLSRSNLDLCVEIVIAEVGKAVPRESDSTIAFIGMGSEEPFVSLWRLDCCAVFAGALQSIDENFAIDPDAGNTGRINYFAQSDRIYTMVNGIHPTLRTFAADYLQKLLENSYDIQPWEAYGRREEFMKMLSLETNSRFVYPMFSTLGAYSITELATFADSLLASQLVSSVFEEGQSSVGGVVEVATIDARNGVIWHRRLPKSKLSSQLQL